MYNLDIELPKDTFIKYYTCNLERINIIKEMIEYAVSCTVNEIDVNIRECAYVESEGMLDIFSYEELLMYLFYYRQKPTRILLAN